MKDRPWDWFMAPNNKKSAQTSNAATATQSVMQTVFGSKVSYALRLVMTRADGSLLYNRFSNEGRKAWGDAQAGFGGAPQGKVIDGGPGIRGQNWVITIGAYIETAANTAVEIWVKW